MKALGPNLGATRTHTAPNATRNNSLALRDHWVRGLKLTRDGKHWKAEKTTRTTKKDVVRTCVTSEFPIRKNSLCVV